MNKTHEKENAHPRYVQTKVAAASLQKARKLLVSFEEENKKDRKWALFAVIFFVVLILIAVLAELF